MSKNRHYLFKKILELDEAGFIEIDLVKMEIFTEKDILEMQKICMSEYYKYFRQLYNFKSKWSLWKYKEQFYLQNY